MSLFCVAAVVRAEDRNAANAALHAAQLPWGLSVPLPPEADMPTHFAQHSWEDQSTIDAMRSVGGIGLLVWSGDEADGPDAAIEGAWTWASLFDTAD